MPAGFPNSSAQYMPNIYTAHHKILDFVIVVLIFQYYVNHINDITLVQVVEYYLYSLMYIKGQMEVDCCVNRVTAVFEQRMK